MTKTDYETVGFIGLGIMGRPMTRSLHKAGVPLVVYNRSPGPIAEFTKSGVPAAESARAAAQKATVLILMLADTPAVEATLTGDNGVLDGLRSGTLVIDMGTTAAVATRRLAGLVRERGGDYVDAPVSGGQVGAEQASLSIMAGGSAEAFARAEPILRVLGKNVTHVGDIGAGQVAKAANQVIVGLTIGAVAEALALAKNAGVDPSRVRAALRGGFADSRILELHGQRMIDGTFKPGGKAVTQRKDMYQALQLADTLDLDLPATALNMQLYDQLIAQGDGELDHSALIKVIDRKRGKR